MEHSSALGSASPAAEPQKNRLLNALPPADFQRWRPHLEAMPMPAGMLLSRWGEHRGHVYFPTTACVSMLHLTRSGESVEVVAVGREGMVGLPVIMGGGPTTGVAVVRTGGHGMRLASCWILSEFHSNAAVMSLLLRYANSLMTHTAQSALCIKLHSLKQCLCRCLLASMDNAGGASFKATHEGLAGVLGVRREGVTGAAMKLQREGVIHCARGQVEVIDRAALETQSCECYRVVKAAYARLGAGSAAGASLAPLSTLIVAGLPAGEMATQASVEPARWAAGRSANRQLAELQTL
jgi:CRP-like cAMP-binding protein